MRAVHEKTILITGATNGFGRALARALACRGARILLHGRSDTRLEETLREIRPLTGSDRVWRYRADFASLREVSRLAREVTAGHRRLDALVNSAGMGSGIPGAAREVSVDGYELRLAVNYLAPFQLTNLLLPLLRRSAPARIVNLAAVGHSAIDFADPMLKRGYDGTRAYQQSKAALIAFTVELAEQLRAEGADITANALHPSAFLKARTVYEQGAELTRVVEEAIEPALNLVVSPDLDGITGRYFDWVREPRALAQVFDPIARQRLWELSEKWAAPYLHRPSRDNGVLFYA